MPLISHRGAGHLGSDNSLDAVKLGDSHDPAFIEVDINCTADNVLVVYHGSVSRFLQGKKTRETYTELLKKRPHVVTLDQILDVNVNAPYIFDIKIDDDESLRKITKKLSMLDREDFAFTSPHAQALLRLQNAFPGSMILQSQPYHHGPITALELARKHNFSGIMLNKWWLTPLVYKLCKRNAKEIGAYTIDSAMAIWLAQRMFPRAFIVTNRPDTYRRLFPIA